MEYLIHVGTGISKAFFDIKKGAMVQAKGPVGKGFPIDNYRGRDLIMAAVGSAIAPLSGMLRSVCHRRTDFGKIVLVYGVRHPDEFAFLSEVDNWRKSNIDVIQIVSRPEGTNWTGKTGHVQAHFGEAIKGLKACRHDLRNEANAGAEPTGANPAWHGGNRDADEFLST